MRREEKEKDETEGNITRGWFEEKGSEGLGDEIEKTRYRGSEQKSNKVDEKKKWWGEMKFQLFGCK